mmetsp:Transcript_16842/g.58770  ORF Transcript_16842/g.58770 Transcript_16842/m.58770 type:complete len:283 (+) Transcript_16842:1660-2508(+)
MRAMLPTSADVAPFFCFWSCCSNLRPAFSLALVSADSASLLKLWTSSCVAFASSSRSFASRADCSSHFAAWPTCSEICLSASLVRCSSASKDACNASNFVPSFSTSSSKRSASCPLAFASSDCLFFQASTSTDNSLARLRSFASAFAWANSSDAALVAAATSSSKDLMRAAAEVSASLATASFSARTSSASLHFVAKSSSTSLMRAAAELSASLACASAFDKACAEVCSCVFNSSSNALMRDSAEASTSFALDSAFATASEAAFSFVALSSANSFMRAAAAS